MNWRLFLLRRWDDVTHFVDTYQMGRFKPPPKPKHEPLTTKEMKVRVRNVIEPLLNLEGFTFDEDWDNCLWWIRPYPSIGLQVIGVGFATKFAPDILGVNLSVGFRAPVVESAVKEICGPLLIAGQRQKDFMALTGLNRFYNDPTRPNKRPPFPKKFTLWNTDFRASEVDKIKDAVQQFALPYFDRIKTVGDLKAIGKSAEDQAVLLTWLGETDSALQFLDEELQKPKRYGPEMRARMECLRKSIESGQLQSLLAEQ